MFAGCPIPAGRLVLKFEGPIYDKDTCPDFSEAIQVGMNAWMWSSGGLDDLVNHSCNPNLGLFPVTHAATASSTNAAASAAGLPASEASSSSSVPATLTAAALAAAPAGSLYLASLRPIAAHEELTFDYSTSMVGEPWGMDCACGEAACRGHIGNFLDLPPTAQTAYAAAGALPLHVAHAYLTQGAGSAAASAAADLKAGASAPDAAAAVPTVAASGSEPFAAVESPVPTAAVSASAAGPAGLPLDAKSPLAPLFPLAAYCA